MEQHTRESGFRPKSFERRLDRFWQDQEMKYDFNSNLNIKHRNNAPTDTGISDEELEIQRTQPNLL